jgi:hypothetical protein
MNDRFICHHCDKLTVVASPDGLTCESCGRSWPNAETFIEERFAHYRLDLSCIPASPGERTRFSLEGVGYQRQKRKCGEARYRCKSGLDSGLHGPYWYARNQATGRVSYIGKSLPAHVARVIDALAAQRRVIEEKRMALPGQADAMGKLLAAEALTAGDRIIIEGLRFADCLVSEPPRAQAQDGF